MYCLLGPSLGAQQASQSAALGDAVRKHLDKDSFPCESQDRDAFITFFQVFILLKLYILYI